MSDLFHETVPVAFLDSVFGIMGTAQHHTFQVLTKRPERMRAYMQGYEKQGIIVADLFPNVWLGVSVENQDQADKRLPILRDTPAAVRFISVEPLLEPVDLCLSPGFEISIGSHGIHWVIAGGESGGPPERHMDLAWLRSIVDQCTAAGVPVFVKQDSGRLPGQQGRIPADLWRRKEFPDAKR
jgi:protein gp37